MMLIYMGIGVIFFFITWNKWAYFWADRPTRRNIFDKSPPLVKGSDYVESLIAIGVVIILLWPISLWFVFRIKIKPPRYKDGYLNPDYKSDDNN
jgi:hypothetical protein